MQVCSSGSRPGKSGLDVGTSVIRSDANSGVKQLLEAATAKLSNEPSRDRAPRGQDVALGTQAHGLDAWQQCLTPEEKAQLESMKLEFVSRDVSHPSAAADAPQLEETAIDAAMGAPRQDDLRPREAGGTDLGAMPLGHGDAEPDHNLMREILAEIRGNSYQEYDGGEPGEADSVTVSEFTSEAGIDQDLALSFTAAKMVGEICAVCECRTCVCCRVRVCAHARVRACARGPDVLAVSVDAMFLTVPSSIRNPRAVESTLVRF